MITVADAPAAVYQLALTSLRNSIGQHDLDEVLQERDKINGLLRQNIAGSTEAWGVEVERFEMKDVELPAAMQEVMAMQAQAIREKRARIIKAEAELEASKKLAAAAQQMAGKPAFYDTTFPGTYNARRDNLEGFWKNQFGHTHDIMVVSSFYENVSLHNVEQRELAPGEKEQNVVLQFKPRPKHDMLVACLWSHWRGQVGEPDLFSFAAITDEPPAEIAAAGHDRCIIPIKPENVDAWLNPDPKNLSASYAILDERERPYYEHRMAA